jgi:DNA mismatch repair protein MutL
MTDRIHVLDEQVINRIAAGEVIERPVSVVKELVENSIDAGARSIIVQVENGGKKLIMVRDDGKGISPDEAFLALERHATSKIRSEEDLVGISTMGFRGEALAAIAAISKFTLRSSDGSEQGGQHIVAEGGVLKSAKPIGMPKGTIIEVRNLFYNVPVRRKFLRKTDLEEAYISELMTKFALGFPWIGFTYSVNQRTKVEAPSADSTFERSQSLYS